jgi:hypothetical protein
LQHANEEQWLALLTAANRSDNPAEAALRRILLVALPAADQQADPAPLPRNHHGDHGDGKHG